MAFGKLGAMGCRLGGAAKTIHKTFMIVAALVAFATEAHAFGNLGSMGRGFGHLGLTSVKKAPAAPVLWTPLYYPNTVAWWDASYLPSLTFNGSNISAWTDRKSGISASQATGANQPAWSATALNGTPGLSFNGTSSSLIFTATLLPTGASSSTIMVGGAGVASGTNRTALFWGNSGLANGTCRILGYGNTSTNLWLSTVTTPQVSTPPSWSGSNLFVYGSIDAANGLQLFSDDTMVGSLAGPVSYTTSGTVGLIGSLNAASGFFSGTLQQIVVTSDVPPTATRQKFAAWESYADGKAGTNLPSSNPYAATGTLHRAPYVSDP